MRLLPCGDAAVLVEVEDLDAVLACYGRLAERPAPGVVDLVPAASTVLVRFDRSRTSTEAIERWVRSVRLDTAPPPSGPAVEIAVTYDGADLAAAAAAVGWSVEDLVAAHTGRLWRVGFAGFVPGFAYLVPEGDWPLVPRRADPRTAVPAGSVAVADRYSGIYPSSSPGGWQLIGRTDVTLWDVDAEPPALLVPGATVRFVAGT